MVLLIVGVAVMALGVFSGAVLLLAPMGLAPWSAGPVLWLLFPLFSVVGYVLFVLGSRSAQIRGFSIVVSCLFLLLALGAAAGLVLGAAAVITQAASTAPLWYVMVVAGVIGIVGAAAYRTPGVEP
jgi:hypothetical protein